MSCSKQSSALREIFHQWTEMLQKNGEKEIKWTFKHKLSAKVNRVSVF